MVMEDEADCNSESKTYGLQSDKKIYQNKFLSKIMF